MELGSIREQIDRLDAEIVALVNRRLALAVEIGKLKRSQGGPIYVAEREDAVLRKVAGLNEGPIRDEALRAIYREVMSAAIALEKPLAIAYLGPAGSDTHAAARRKFGTSVVYRTGTGVADLFATVERGGADYAVIPIENCAAGPVREALDRFVESELKIVAQIFIDPGLTLVSSSSREAIERVHGSERTLARCREWLQRNLPRARLVDTPDHDLALRYARDESGAAAVSGELAAEAHGLPVLERNIQDAADTARFFVLGRTPSGPVGGGQDMTSLLVSLGDAAASQSGALLRVLRPFAQRGINLAKIESRPNPRCPWDYCFFLDLAGHHEDADMQAALAELQEFCPLAKWLGSYPGQG